VIFRLALRAATVIGLAAAIAGGARVAYLAGAGEFGFIAGAGTGLMVASGLAAAACALLLESAEAELDRLRRDRAILKAEGDLNRARVRGLERRAESLSLVREIHRSTNIITRGERLRQVLSVIGQLGTTVEAALFAAASSTGSAQPSRAPRGAAAGPKPARGEEGGDPVLRLAAYLRRDREGELFIRLDGEVARADRLSVGDAVVTSNGTVRELAADLAAAGERAGRIEAVLPRTPETRPATPSTGWAPPYRASRAAAGAGLRGAERAREELASLLSSADLDPAAATAALAHGQVLRAHDRSRDLIELVYPLTAEGAGVGALRVRLPAREVGEFGAAALAGDGGAAAGGSGRDGLGELEEVLGECTRHVALAIKKEADADRAVTDGLTGLLLRREFEPRLEEAIARAAEERRPLALLVVDIDHFKSVNDVHGHRSGDAVLRGVASLVRRHIRACDAAFRYGGEEISVVLPGSASREAKVTAERLRAAVEAAAFTGDGGREIGVTISVGVAAYDPRRSRSPRPPRAPDLFRRADAAVYRAKALGRNAVVAWAGRTGRSGRSRRRGVARSSSRRRTASSRWAGPGTQAMPATTASGRASGRMRRSA
jgi:diguanylate cyclase (GGDEF)-like protein